MDLDPTTGLRRLRPVRFVPGVQRRLFRWQALCRGASQTPRPLKPPSRALTDLSQIGGSYATIPQIASRKSFRNWYQANYPYSFIGGRVAYDA